MTLNRLKKIVESKSLSNVLKFKKDILIRNDPSAGSPTETLLRLLFPLSAKVYLIFRLATIKKVHLSTQSAIATGGVYILQGRNQHKLMTCAY